MYKTIDYYKVFKEVYRSNNLEKMARWLESLKFIYCLKYQIPYKNERTFTSIIAGNHLQKDFREWFSKNYRKYSKEKILMNESNPLNRRIAQYQNYINKNTKDGII